MSADKPAGADAVQSSSDCALTAVSQDFSRSTANHSHCHEHLNQHREPDISLIFHCIIAQRVQKLRIQAVLKLFLCLCMHRLFDRTRVRPYDANATTFVAQRDGIR